MITVQIAPFKKSIVRGMGSIMWWKYFTDGEVDRYDVLCESWLNVDALNEFTGP